MAVLRPHLALTVSDVERSIPFYEALFGVAPSKVRPGYAKFEVADPALNFTLNEGARDESLGAFNHAGLQVSSTEDVLMAKLRLQKAGLATLDEMDTTCCYAKQDKIWVHDPDGTPWELFATHGDDEPTEDHPQTAEPSACCQPMTPLVREAVIENSAGPLRGVGPPAPTPERDTASAMSRENVEVVRQVFEAFLGEDRGKTAQLVDPEVEFHGTVGGLQEGQVAHGRAQIDQTFEAEDLEAWEERRLEPEEFIDAGDNVVVLLHEYRRGRGSGVELETDTAVVVAVREGRVVRIQGYLDRAEALEAAGVSQ